MSSLNKLLNKTHTEIARLRHGLWTLTANLTGERRAHQHVPVRIRTPKRRESS